MAKRGASELECVVLGVVWKFGPCTPHAIRTHFTQGRSTRFTASAGAIYPLVSRLERRGWLKSRRDARGRQARRVYTLAPAGLRQLQRWLGPPFGDADFSVLHDPLRIRIYFLGALGAAERETFFADALEGLRQTLQRLRADVAGYDAAEIPFSGAALRGAVALVQTQMRWLKGLRRELAETRAAPRPKAPRRSPTSRPRAQR